MSKETSIDRWWGKDPSEFKNFISWILNGDSLAVAAILKKLRPKKLEDFKRIKRIDAIEQGNHLKVFSVLFNPDFQLLVVYKPKLEVADWFVRVESSGEIEAMFLLYETGHISRPYFVPTPNSLYRSVALKDASEMLWQGRSLFDQLTTGLEGEED